LSKKWADSYEPLVEAHFDAAESYEHAQLIAEIGIVMASLASHFLLLAWLLHSPRPIFVAPSYLMKGENGSAVTRLYFGGRTGVTQERSPLHLTAPHSKTAELHRLPPLPPMAKAGNTTVAALRPNDLPGGSPYGSLSYGSLAGSEVRPLPVSSPDPLIDHDIAASLTGDVIVEVAIDEAGTIVEMKVLQGLGPAIDQPVLAVLEKWHFLPATRNGTPIPSKQDVYYHFPR